MEIKYDPTAVAITIGGLYWGPGSVRAVSGCACETLWIGADPVGDVWEIQTGTLWSVRGGRSGYVSADLSTTAFDDAKAELLAYLGRSFGDAP